MHSGTQAHASDASAGPAGGLSLGDVSRFAGGMVLHGGPEVIFSRVITDSREARPGDLFVALAGERFDGHDFVDRALAAGAQGLLVHRPVSLKTQERNPPVVIQVPDTLQALGDLAAGWRRKFSTPVGALTGSNGKTTTKEMTVAVLQIGFRCLTSRGNFNNRIGLPLTLLKLDADYERVILEMGMNEPGEIRALTRICGPDAGALINIGPAHLGRFASMDDVARAKGEILEAMPAGSVFVFNQDDPRVRAQAATWKGPVRSFGLSEGCHVTAREVVEVGFRQRVVLAIDGKEISTELRLPGRHNLYNALAAAALSSALGASGDAIRQGLSGFRGVPGRFVVRPGKGVTVVDDSYNANPRSMAASLETFAKVSEKASRMVVLGDMLELGRFSEQEHEELGRCAARVDPALLCITGDYAACVSRGAVHEGFPADRVVLFQDPQEAVARIRGALRGGEWILVKGSRGMALERVVDLLLAEDARGSRE